MTGADLRDANVTQTDLRGADLSDADLRGADLGRAELEGCRYSDDTRWPWFYRPRGAVPGPDIDRGLSLAEGEQPSDQRGLSPADEPE